MKKMLSLALAAAMCLSLLAGCSAGTPDPTATPAPENSTAPAEASTAPEGGEPAGLTGTLKVSLWDLATQPAFDAVIKAFVDANPGRSEERRVGKECL